MNSKYIYNTNPQMTESPAQDGGIAADVSIPRGGPIYTANMVSPLTGVSDFEASVLQELQNLQTALCSESTELCDDDILVDDLKIVTEDELVSKAFEEAFKDDDQVDVKMSTRNSNACSENSGHGTDTGSANNESSSKIIAKKRKRVNGKKNRNLEAYSAKIEQLVKIKEKQEEEKAAARLHSFNGGSRTNDTERMAMTSLRSIGCATNVNSLNSSNDCGDHVPVIYPEIVLCVEVYNNKKIWVKTQEFLVLGCQPLTELRDNIYCLTDQVMQKAGQHDPSGYFLIEDVFCNDLRDSNAIDYSEPILNWLRNSEEEAIEKWEWIVSGELQKKQKAHLGSAMASQLPCFRAVDMHKTRFCDLRFRVGAGYVYCHQGDCKHIVVVRDMRLIHPKDAQNRKVYPIVTFQLKERFQKCSVCKICRAEKMTVDDKWAAENPCYFCKNCYYMLHYANGLLLYEEFSVYDYFHE